MTNKRLSVKIIDRILPIVFILALSLVASPVFAQNHDHNHDHDHDHAAAQTENTHAEDCGADHEEHSDYDPVATVMHHIADANEFHIWKGVHIPLPLFLYSPETGWKTGLSSMFEHGHLVVDGYLLNHGRVNKIADANFPSGEVHLNGILHKMEAGDDGKEKDVYYACANSQLWKLDNPSTLDGGILGGGITSFYDFSITKNVFTMFLAALLLILLWNAVAKGYRKNEGKAPSGVQSFVEPIFLLSQCLQ